MRASVLILDYGSQYTQLIARRTRELGLYSMIVPAHASLERISSYEPRAIVLSGGPSSVYERDAPRLPAGLIEYASAQRLPILGICYGMQLLVQALGGEVKPGRTREYGAMSVEGSADFFPKKHFIAWMSHGDSCERLPAGYQAVARSNQGAVAAMQSSDGRTVGLQFHPEVTHTESGAEILKNFFLKHAGLRPEWSMRSFLAEETQRLKDKVAPTDHVICALSGGVDSAVAAALVSRAIGDRLHCVFVDHGLLRFQERERVMQMLEHELRLPVECVDASDRFFKALERETDPEKKRKIIGRLFIETFQQEAERLSARLGVRPRFLVQGTLYPDVIESSPAPQSAQGGVMLSQTIKSHHNVGGLPEKLGFELIEPLRDLFKDEVRALGAELQVPQSFLSRHPFPGPGLAVRILGEVTRERVEILQKADEIYVRMLREEGLYDQIWQAFAVFLPIRSVGVQGDGRTHEYVLGLRAVTSSDGMTARAFGFEPEFLSRVSTEICNRVRGVNRVVYDVTSKPPATIEWE
jgi:GMP synthase (glutamine-hydrolysing)